MSTARTSLNADADFSDVETFVPGERVIEFDEEVLVYCLMRLLPRE
jgi:hypothetical protein